MKCQKRVYQYSTEAKHIYEFLKDIRNISLSLVDSQAVLDDYRIYLDLEIVATSKRTSSVIASYI